ncbi:hypothetical protein [Streptomyces sp. DH37]|uniref:hypothetical protein n=1 Tax=Streptomyces sp. DH37 TaxID=3040122 RepID=UPI00244347A5|nr:hypothetical protein [Streptomyces sp. DH37]MDG9703729.1 hypothetical protein [Streptomyces sp. DH37]
MLLLSACLCAGLCVALAVQTVRLVRLRRRLQETEVELATERIMCLIEEHYGTGGEGARSPALAALANQTACRRRRRRHLRLISGGAVATGVLAAASWLRSIVGQSRLATAGVSFSAAAAATVVYLGPVESPLDDSPRVRVPAPTGESVPEPNPTSLPGHPITNTRPAAHSSALPSAQETVGHDGVTGAPSRPTASPTGPASPSASGSAPLAPRTPADAYRPTTSPSAAQPTTPATSEHGEAKDGEAEEENSESEDGPGQPTQRPTPPACSRAALSSPGYACP